MEGIQKYLLAELPSKNTKYEKSIGEGESEKSINYTFRDPKYLDFSIESNIGGLYYNLNECDNNTIVTYTYND